MFRREKNVTPDDRTLSDQAINWKVRLQSEEATADDRRAFEDWKKQSDRHRAACIRIDSLWNNLDDPSRIVWEEVQQGIEPAHAFHPSTSTKWKGSALIAASVALVVLCGFWITDSGDLWSSGTISTARGDHTSVTLQDGSTVYLNTSTTISVAFTERQRRIVLKKGEAWFSVAPDRTRPFEVQADNGIARAVGTEFNVRQEQDGATVTVIEGTVEVSQPDRSPSDHNAVRVMPVTAGEQIRYGRRTGIGHVSHADLVQVTGWRRGQLVFDLKPLAEVVTEVDRYWPGKILVMNSDLRRHRISGVFKTGDPDTVVRALETTFRMKSVKVAGYLIVLY